MARITKADRAKLRKDWIKALRSGKYKQGTGSLEEDGKNCCLGVACRVALKRFPKLIVVEACVGNNATHFDNEASYLPDKVRIVFGFRDSHGGFEIPEEGKSGTLYGLTDANDLAKWSFKKIATYVEKHPENVFKD
jgi:hypothetical protein